MIDIDPNQAIEDILKNSGLFAKAKAERIFLEEFRKSKKSLLMQNHKNESIGAQEREAYAHPAYIKLLDGLRAAIEEEERLRWELVAAQAKVDVWRSQEASNRRETRVTV